MERYSGQALGELPHIVVLGSCKVGNFIVSIPVLNGLRARFPDSTIGFIGSELTADFEQALACVDWRISWDASIEMAGQRLVAQLSEQVARCGPVVLALNLDGFNPVTTSLVPWLNPRFVAGGSLTRNRRRQLHWGTLPQQAFLADLDWDSEAFLQRYKDVFSSNYIAELFCHLAFVADLVDVSKITLPFEVPPFDVPDVLIHCTTARGAKVWPFSSWKQVVDALHARGLSVGLVGSPPAAQREAYNAGDGEDWLLRQTSLIDLRGSTTLIELAGACQMAKAVISVDAGPLHIAAAVNTPTLAVVGNDANGVGASPIRLWLPRSSNVQRTISEHNCGECSQRRFRNDDCVVDGHPCMQGVKPQQVIDWLDQVLVGSNG